MVARLRFYGHRELSEMLGTRLSRWKRWSREFLPPDSLGGLQSGYARQLTIDDAFTVYLGGHLVSVLKYGIPSARCILSDLRDWLGAAGFYQTPIYRSKNTEDAQQQVRAYQIYINAHDTMTFSYTIRGILDEDVHFLQDERIRTVRYRESNIGESGSRSGGVTKAGVGLLNITGVHAAFSRHINH